jgi:hypothetical protein
LQGASQSHQDPLIPASEGEGFPVFGRERDTGVEPATFSLGKRKKPFQAVTGSAK